MSDFSKFLVMFPISLIFFTFLTILIYRAFFSMKSWESGKLVTAAVAATVGIVTLIVSMVSIASAHRAANEAKFVWNFLPYIIIMLGSLLVLIWAIIFGHSNKTA